MISRRSRWVGSAVWISLAAILLGLVGQFGRVSLRADAINFFAPAWLLAGLLAALFILIASREKRQKLLACCMVAALALIALTLVLPDRGVEMPADCPGEDLTLIQFNVFKGNPDVRPAVAWIGRTRADLVILEEAADELPIVAMLRPQYPYIVSCSAAMRCSTVIMSRRPFVASGGLARGDPENRKALSAAWAIMPSRIGPFTIVAAHLDRPWPWHSSARQLAALTAFVRGQGGDATLVAGDFNRPSWTFQIRHLTEALDLARAPDVRSWPVTAGLPPLWAIDHVFFGRLWTIERLSRGPRLGSDHYPLLVSLRYHLPKCQHATGDR